jgi:hypothetical protein
MAEKIKTNLSNGQKKSSDEQFLKGSRNWESFNEIPKEVRFSEAKSFNQYLFRNRV